MVEDIHKLLARIAGWKVHGFVLDGFVLVGGPWSGAPHQQIFLVGSCSPHQKHYLLCTNFLRSSRLIPWKLFFWKVWCHEILQHCEKYFWGILMVRICRCGVNTTHLYHDTATICITVLLNCAVTTHPTACFGPENKGVMRHSWR